MNAKSACRPLLTLLAAGYFGLVCSQTWSETVTLTPAADTSITSLDANNNLGREGTLAAGGIAQAGQKFRMLLRFDFADQIPPGSTIHSVSLRLRVTKKPNPGVPSSFGLHRLLKAWTEGTKTGLRGSPATAGEVTWNNLAAPDTPWSAPGGAAPEDFVAEASGAQTMDAVGNYTFNSTEGLVADVQAWVDDPARNFGWLLISDRETTPRTARRIASREAAVANRPTLTVEFTPGVAATPPQITQGPADQTVAAGSQVVFSVAATGSEPLSYQWKRGDEDLPGQTGSTLTLDNVQAGDAGVYTVVVSNAAGSAAASATLVVLVPPTITTPPADQTVSVGDNVTFTVVATGSEPLSYQWKHGEELLPSAMQSTLSLSNVQESDAGTYTVEVRNAAGLASASATLTVQAVIAPPQIEHSEIVDGRFRLSFTAAPQRTYVVQSRDTATAGEWTTVQTFAPPHPAGPTLVFVDERPLAAGQRFYRLGVLP